MMNRQIAIVGGGASGALVAAQLLRQGRQRPADVVLVEPSPAVGLGLAYRTRDEVHRLNVPAGRISAFPDDPGHFLRWARERGATADEWSYLPRPDYGRYLQDVLAAAGEDAGDTRLHAVRGVAERLVPVDTHTGIGLLYLESGRCLPYDRLVLATGHAGPSPLPASVDARATGRVIDDPWAPGALEHAASAATAANDDEGLIVLVGTGLTMVDVTLTLARLAPGAAITALSRHGLAPQPHPRRRRPRQLEPLCIDGPVTARLLLRTVREAVEKAMSEGDDWTGVIDDLRPITTRLWQSLDLAEQRRFLRHVGRRWDVVRHRMAPVVGDEIARLEISGALALRAARVREVRAAGPTLEVAIRHAGQERVLRAAAVVNCTGPCSDVARGATPFLRRLVDEGAATPHPLGLGLAVDDRGALIGADGTASPTLHTIGPLRCGHLFESTAIPEIRSQAADLAALLLADLDGAPLHHPNVSY